MATHYDQALRLYLYSSKRELEGALESHKQKLHNAKKEVGNQTDYVKAIRYLIKEKNKEIYPWVYKH